MYWCFWGMNQNGPYLENVSDVMVDALVEDSMEEIVFEAELVTE